MAFPWLNTINLVWVRIFFLPKTWRNLQSEESQTEHWCRAALMLVLVKTNTCLGCLHLCRKWLFGLIFFALYIIIDGGQYPNVSALPDLTPCCEGHPLLKFFNNVLPPFQLYSYRLNDSYCRTRFPIKRGKIGHTPSNPFCLSLIQCSTRAHTHTESRGSFFGAAEPREFVEEAFFADVSLIFAEIIKILAIFIKMKMGSRSWRKCCQNFSLLSSKLTKWQWF